MNRIVLAMVISLGFGGIAAAQTSPLPSPCGGQTPVVGAEVRGPVLHVLNGHSLCVAQSPDPTTWIAVELADAPQDASRGALMSVAFGKDAVCKVGDGGKAICKVGGRVVGQRLNDAAVIKAGLAWEQPAAPVVPAAPASRGIQMASVGG